MWPAWRSMARSPASRPSAIWPATAFITSRAGSSRGRSAGASSVRSTGTNIHWAICYFDCGGVRIGFEICEDAWVANRPGAELSLRGIDIILNPSASHFAFGKMAVRERFVLEGSRAFGVHYVYANLVGNEAGRAIYDGGAMIASAGKMIRRGPRFSFADWGVTSALVDIDAARLSRARTGSFAPELDTSRRNVCITCHLLSALRAGDATPASTQRGRPAPNVKEEEFARAISLALFDYMRKSRSRGFVVSISGGADSAAVSCLVAMMVDFGMAELGREAFWQSLTYFPEIQPAKNNREIVRQLVGLRLSIDPPQRRYHARQPPAAWPKRSARNFSSSTSIGIVQGLCRHGFAQAIGRAAHLGSATIWRCKTFKPGRARPACGCWRICAARCWPRPAIARKRPSATPRWMATPPAASARSPASTKHSCAAGCGGWKRSGPEGHRSHSALARGERARSDGGTCARRAPAKPTKPT